MRSFIKILSRLPLPVHYAFADGLIFPLAYYLLRYRRDVVTKNLTNAFPDKSQAEIKALSKAFYHHLADTIVEIIYGYTISDEEMRERVVYHNIEALEKAALEKGGAIVMLGHMGNWEWVSDIAKRYSDPSVREICVYRQLKNKTMDALMLDIREQRGTAMAEMKQILRAMIKQRAEKVPTTYGMLSDQKPSPVNSHFWTTFLHQDTAFLSGSDTLARKFDYPVFYFYITSPKRGYYDVDIRPIAENPIFESEWGIVQKYAILLEENILAQPHLWLWSHNRWKHKRPQ